MGARTCFITKLATVLLTALLFARQNESQAQELIWQRVERGHHAGVVIDSQSNIITLNTLGDHEVIKYSLSGDILWRATDGLRLNGSLAIDPNDNIVKISERAFVTKINSGGVILWIVDMRDLCYCLYGVACDSDGNIFVTGEDYSTFTAKLDPNGEVLWTRHETLYGFGTCCAVDPWGDVVVSSIEQGSLWHDFNWRIIKYSSAGDKLWERVEGSPWEELGGGVCTDHQGNVYIAGDWIAKYDRDGNLIWFDPWGMRGGSIIFDGLNNIYLESRYWNQPTRIAKCDLDGLVVWEIPCLGGPEASINGLSYGEEDNLAVSSGDGDANVMITALYYLGPLSAISYDAESPGGLRVLPNPVTSGATLTFEGPQMQRGCVLRIYDLSGRAVKQMPCAGTQVLWNLHDRAGYRLPPGAYVCRLLSSQTSVGSALLVVK